MFICEKCGKTFSAPPSRFRRDGRPPFCSRRCYLAALPTDVERFWANVRKGTPNECWEWQGGRYTQGYGAIYFQGKHMKAHRVAFLLARGRLPTANACHTCDNPPCVNPSHLFDGTPLSNNRDKIAKGRAPDGAKHGRAKLTDADVLVIRSDYARGGVRQIDLARKYGVSKAAIWYAIHGGTWDHVTTPSPS